MAYINFINGLRGISIILVLFYHLFDTNIFRNGFLGVDFFFVISGFILTYKYHSQKFNLKTFFYNRFRRIIPSLVLCIIFVHLLLFLLINDNFILKENYKLIQSTLFFVNNFYLLDSINYFNSNIENYLTYHLWSLSIEEQFYIVFPFILLFGKNFYKVLLFILFLILSIYVYKNTIILPLELNEENNFTLVADNFFSPTLRFAELIFGCFSAVIIKSISGKFLKNKIINNAINFLCLSFLIYIVFFFNLDKDYHPGLITILISLITSILIINLFFTTQNPTLTLLNSRSLQFFGNISYTLYLFHVPLFFLLNFYLKENLLNNVFIVSIIIFISFIIWKFYEYPLYKGYFNYKLLLIFPFLYICIITFTYWNANYIELDINKTQNYSFQKIIDERKTSNKCFIHASFVRKIDESCFDIQDKKNIVVFWGDSHASALAMIFQNNFKQYDVVTFNASTCAPRFYDKNYNSFDGKYCEINNKLATNFLKKNLNSVMRVIVHSSIHLDQFDANIVKDFKFTAIGPSPIWEGKMLQHLNKNKFENNTLISNGLKSEHIQTEGRLKNYFKKFKNIKYISLQDFLCSQENKDSDLKCLAIIRNKDEIFPYSYDHGHISSRAGEYLYDNYLYDKIFR